MENLLNQLVTMETISILRAELTDQILAYIDDNNLSGDYELTQPFEVADGNFVYAFEVEEDDECDRKAIYFYIRDIDAEQIEGAYIWDVNLNCLKHFYSKLLEGFYQTLI